MKYKLIYLFAFLMALTSCGRKHAAQKNQATIIYSDSTSMASPAPEVIKKAKPKAVFPKIIAVNDDAAKKSTDGRLYYDVMGHRYWKNYKDGKYYIFNKSMYNNSDFKAR